MKRGQMKLSFGMIFSIILIIIFLSFAFYAIYKFMGTQKALQIGKFVDGTQADIDKMWKSSQGSQETEYRLGSNIEYVCFIDYASPKTGPKEELYDTLKQNYYGGENLFFYPIPSVGELNSFEINHIDLEKITKEQNPFCIENEEGEVKMTIKKNYGDILVTITR